MSRTKPRCARGQSCYHVRELRSEKPPTVAYEGDLCEKCQKEKRSADIEASQRHLGAYPHLTELEELKDNPEKKRLVALKRGLVAQMLGKPGAFRKRVEKVRGYWQINDPPVQLPPKSEDILLPPNIEESEDLASLYAVATNHPHLSPSSAMLPQPDSLDSVRSNLILRWEIDLRDILSAVDGLGSYLKEPRGPCVVHPLGGEPIPQEHLPWYRFAAACVLYGVPLGEAPAFADYGGLNRQPMKPPLRAWSGRELREREMERRIWDEQEKFIITKICEKHSLDYYSEMHDIFERFYTELEEEIPKRIREEHELAMEHSPPRHYHIEYIPGKHTNQDLTNTRAAIDEQAGVDTRSGPKPETPKDDLKPVWCALLRVSGWSIHSISESLNKSPRTAENEVKEGWNLLGLGD